MMDSPVIIFVLVAQAIVCGCFAGNIAEHKKQSSGAWFAAGFFFGIFGLIAVIGLPMKTPVEPLSDFNKKCPSCAEFIKIEAKICKHCRNEFSEIEIISELSQIFDNGPISNQITALDILSEKRNEIIVPILFKIIRETAFFDATSPEYKLFNSAIENLLKFNVPTIGLDLVNIAKQTKTILKQMRLIDTIGLIRDVSTLPFLLDCLANYNLKSYAEDAIINFGQSAIPDLEIAATKGTTADRRLYNEIIKQIVG